MKEVNKVFSSDLEQSGFCVLGNIDNMEPKEFFAAARAIGGEHLSRDEIIQILYFSSRKEWSAGRIARILHSPELGLGTSEVIRILSAKSLWNCTPEQVAKALSVPSWVHIAAEHIAHAMQSSAGIHLSPERITRALCAKEGLGLGVEKMLRILTSRQGLGLHLGNAVKVLHSPDGGAFSAAEIAGALNSPDGMRMDLDNVGQVLFFKNGLGLPLADVVRAMVDGTGASLTKVLQELYKGGGLDLRALYATHRHGFEPKGYVLEGALVVAKMLLAPAPDGMGLSIEETTMLLSELGMGVWRDKICRLLFAPDGLNLGIEETARLLYAKNAAALDIEEVIECLIREVSEDPDDVVRAMLSEKGANLTRQDILDALQTQDIWYLTKDEVRMVLGALKKEAAVAA